MLTSVLHQDVLAVRFLGDFIFAGTGGDLLIFYENRLITSKQLFRGQKIHSIIVGDKNFFVLGGKQIAVCELTGKVVHILGSWKCDDWILDGLTLAEDELAVLTSHNQVQLWNFQKRSLKACSAPTDRCILYSGKLSRSCTEGVIVLSGTVYSEVIIWRPDFENVAAHPDILCRLTGHKGVIFSITMREISRDHYRVCTTSDDRSLRLWYITGPWDTAKVSARSPMFGHTARVWRNLQLEECVVTIGEDSTVCVWEYSGELRSRIFLHKGGGIRGLDFCAKTSTLVTGGEDGGIFVTPWTLFSEFAKKTAVCFPLNTKEIPRKVVFSKHFGVVYLTEKGRLVSGDNDLTVACSDEFKKCTDLKTNLSGELLLVCNRLGLVFIVYKDGSHQRLVLNKDSYCENILISENYLLVHLKHRDILLHKLVEDSGGLYGIKMISSFILPKGKDLSPACFCYLPEENGKLLVGDRLGGLHYYFESQNPAHSLKKLHSSLGVSDVIFNEETKTILSIGAGGWIREMKFKENHLEVVHSRRINLENASKFLDTPAGKIIVGFHSTHLQIWHITYGYLLGEYNCGGSHRSYSFRLRNHSLDFLFIKDKQVNIVSFNLNTHTVLRNSFHAKVINALTLVDADIFVSGGEDTVLRLWKFVSDDVMTLVTAEQHVSSIRAIAVVHHSSTKRLIISVGGREQIVLTGFNTATKELTDISSHFSRNTLAEGRYMCLAAEKLPNGSVLILVGCSDCSVRLFVYSVAEGLVSKARLMYNCCILRVAILRTNNELTAVTFGTDGQAVFWDISRWDEEEIDCFSPSAEIQLHASGINSYGFRILSPGKFLLISGGDDNKLSAAVIERDGSSWMLASVWSSSSLHSCQITGIALHENLAITTSIDQRVIILELPAKFDPPALTLLEEMTTTVPDIHGISLFHNNNNQRCALLFGKGIEVITIK